MGIVCAIGLLAGCASTEETTEASGNALDEGTAWSTELNVSDASEWSQLEAWVEARSTRGRILSRHGTASGRPLALAYRIVRADRPRAAVVVLNGRTETFEHYKEVAYDLARRGYTLYMLDHRGQGHSDRTIDFAQVGDDDYQRGHVEDFQHYVDDADTFISEVVLPKTKQTPLYGLAHSMGGAVLTAYAEQKPSTLRALALSAPMHKLPIATLSLVGARVCAFFAPTTYAKDGPLKLDDPFDQNGLTQSRARFDMKYGVWATDQVTRVGGPTCRWVATSGAATKTIRANAGKITAPVLILQAGADTIVDPGGQREVCDGINRRSQADRPLCRLEVLDGAKHEALMEVDDIRQRALDLVDAHFRAAN